MQKNINNIQPTDHTNVRISRVWSRVRLSLAGTGLAGALLVSGLFGTPAAHAQPARTAQTHVASTSRMKTAPMFYSMANDYVGLARQAALNAGINPDAFVRQIQQESGFNPDATSSAGAVGIAQFMPGTAASMGVNPYDPASALNGAARMMASQAAQFGGNYAMALAAYNAGAGAVQGAVARGGGNWLSYMPAETQNYVHTIMG